MKQFFLPLLCSFGFLPALFSQNQPPQISAFSVVQLANSIQLMYQLSDEENDPLEVTVQFSSDGGQTFSTLTAANVSGDVGFPVVTGIRSAICTGLNLTPQGVYAFRVVADDRQPFDYQSLVNEVDSNRLRSDLEIVEGVRHYATGAAHLEETRSLLLQNFYGKDMHVATQVVPNGNFPGKNIIASAPGTADASKVVVVDAHYDSYTNAPGADDNGSGTVGVLEIARLLSRYPSKKTQRYIGFDLEESGLVGSIRYVSSGIPATETIEGVFNFEMIGYWSNQPNSQTLPTGFGLLFPLQTQMVADNQYRGDFITNVGNTNSQPLALLFSNSAQQYVPGLKMITLDVPGTGSLAPDLRRSDHAPFWDSGRKALMITDGANFRNECYHTPFDTLNEKLNFTFMSNVVKATLAAMAQLAEVQHGDWETVFFVSSSESSEPMPCGLEVRYQEGLQLSAESCWSDPLLLELYDLKGALVFHQEVQVGNGLFLPTPELTAGVYFLKLGYQGKIFSRKLVVP